MFRTRKNTYCIPLKVLVSCPQSQLCTFFKFFLTLMRIKIQNVDKHADVDARNHLEIFFRNNYIRATKLKSYWGNERLFRRIE